KAQVQLRLIMIPSHASDGNAAAQKAMADEIFGKLVNGAEFERMAQLYSEDSTREKGGDWGWVDRKTLAAPLEKAAFSLEPGKISHVIDFGGNYYIIKVDDKHGGETKSLADARAEIETDYGFRRIRRDRTTTGLQARRAINRNSACCGGGARRSGHPRASRRAARRRHRTYPQSANV